MLINGIKFLVTGGAGFVGSNIVNQLIKSGAKVTVLDDLSTGFINILPLDNPLLEFVEGSVVDFNIVDDLVKRCDIVIHASARNIIASTSNPMDDYNVNIGGTLNVLLAARKYEVKRVVYCSSASVYGNPKYLPINEDDSCRTLSPYSVSKLSGENYCNAFYESYAVSTAVVRYSNVYGINQRPDNPYCGVISKFFHAVLNGNPPSIHGDGEQTRDFTYVSDVVEATILAAVSQKAEGQTYNVATGIESSINTLARMIIEICNSSVIPIYVDKRDIDNIRRRVLNIEKIRRELRWVPGITLKRGLEKTKTWLEEGYY
jgi:UDP-glucose 4-epimerase